MRVMLADSAGAGGSVVKKLRVPRLSRKPHREAGEQVQAVLIAQPGVRAFLAQLRAELDREHFGERAAIFEFDRGFPRAEAERLASDDVLSEAGGHREPVPRASARVQPLRPLDLVVRGLPGSPWTCGACVPPNDSGDGR